MATAKEPVTVPTEVSVDDFLAAVSDERRRADAGRLRAIMGEVTGEPAVMWGPSIVGFGSYHYSYDSGRTGEAPLVGFSPRKQHLVVYLVGGFEQRYGRILERLGPHHAGKGCLYLKRLDTVDESALRELLDRTARVHQGVDRASGR
ncbi:protein of unknown function (DU1801) [Micromonospora coriariae]|uniref:YdhG-like domain-containing protein n=1 Tax=Micromonospora coriariae TaxID=285665 RepID=A0A1C4XGS0_9ACTN|nr:DUF1801 domain-containing protein [Micromonospora coriariae]SCF07557.1 protein of unknown function (DU1801) [Micromonospora coriariae]